MKKIALFSLVLALGLFFVQPLQADTIAYTIQYNFSRYGSSDPLGIGSGNGTAILNFSLTPPDVGIVTGSNFSDAYYSLGSPTVTLSGNTNANGTYAASSWAAVLDNAFSLSLSYDNILVHMDAPISGINYGFAAICVLPQYFWDDAEVPALPKLVRQSDVLPSGQGGNIYGAAGDKLYFAPSVAISSQVVPVPPTVWLLGSGLLGLGALGWRRKRD